MEQNKRYIIFGVGKVGKELLEIWGKEQIVCFLDSNAASYKNAVGEVPVVDPDRLMDYYTPDITVVIGTVVGRNMIEMATKLDTLGVPYTLYEEIFDGEKNPFTDWQIEIAKSRIFVSQGHKYIEEYTYYDFTTSLLVSVIRENGLYGKKALSLGAKVGEMVGIVNLFQEIFHCTMIPMQEYDDLEICGGGGKIIQMNEDFWKLKDERLKEVEVFFSYSTIHCLCDSRYGNKDHNYSRIGNIARRLKDICPKLKYAVISVPVNMEDHIENNNTWLGNKKFVESFEKEGFSIKKTIYDKKCSNNRYTGNRLTLAFPEEYCLEHKYVIGNYFFVR